LDHKIEMKDNTPFFCSWSGGKDCCLALHKAIESGGTPGFLFTMFIENGDRTHSHGLSKKLISAQAASLGIPLRHRSCGWDDYEEKFVNAVREMKHSGMKTGVFGDIDFEENREWEEKVCATSGLNTYIPLWQIARKDLLDEFLSSGFKSMIVSANNKLLGIEYLGRTLDRELIAEFQERGIDLSGENGEYHTVVFDGPIFSNPLDLIPGKKVLRSGYWFLDFSVNQSG